MLIAKNDIMKIIANLPEQINLYDLQLWLESFKIKQIKATEQSQLNSLKIGKASQRLSPSFFEDSDSPSVYSGSPLSLEDMQAAIAKEAEKHKW